MEHPADLLIAWRDRATYLEQFGDSNSAKLWRIACAELERVLASVDNETLSLAEAAAISGHSVDHIGGLIRTGKLPHAGRKNAPRIALRDVPKKKPNSRGRPVRRRILNIVIGGAPDRAVTVRICGVGDRQFVRVEWRRLTNRA